MTEAEPICSVAKKWKSCVGNVNRVMNDTDEQADFEEDRRGINSLVNTKQSVQ